MNKTLLTCIFICASMFISFQSVFSAEESKKPKLDVLAMKRVPTGFYDVSLQLPGETYKARLVLKDNMAGFVSADNVKLKGLSGRFQLIGNGVFLAQLVGENHRASQWWIFHPDGTASIKEIPDRGEKQKAIPVEDPKGDKK